MLGLCGDAEGELSQDPVQGRDCRGDWQAASMLACFTA